MAKIWYTKDGGTNWNNVDARTSRAAAARDHHQHRAVGFDAGTAYVSVDLHLVITAIRSSTRPLISARHGSRSPAICPSISSPTCAIAEDPNAKGLLFAGTGNGLFYSLDDGAEWKPLETGLPHAPG